MKAKRITLILLSVVMVMSTLVIVPVSADDMTSAENVDGRNAASYEDMLQVFYQIKKGSEKGTAVRVVTTIDSLNYQTLIYTIVANGKTATIKDNNVYTSIIVEGKPFTDAAAIGSPNSKYFATFTLDNITNVAFFTVQISVVDLNGTVHCGFAYTVEINASAEETPGLKYTLNADRQSYSVKGIGTYSDSELIIPNTYKGLPVTSIGEAAFQSCDSLIFVTIPDSVTSIGEAAFRSCESLMVVTIPDSVTSIGDDAFYDCTSLMSVTIGNGVTSIGSYAFGYCRSISSIIIPNSVTSIGNSAFSDCYCLDSVTIGNSVTSIDDSAFSGCSSLMEIAIPDNVTSIGNHTFEDCSSLTSITIPDSVTSIGYFVFSGCSSLTSVEIPDSVTSIGIRAFYECSSLMSITIGKGVTSIDVDAFYNCYKLIEVINHSSLSITTGSRNYGYIAYYAKEVHGGETKIVKQEDCLFYTYGRTNYLIEYKGMETELVLPDSYNGQEYVIYQYAFEDCSSLTSITIGNGVTSIGDGAFRNCSSLTSITIGNGVTSIGDGAFHNCSSLTSINYRGTQSQWEAISKGSDWDSYTGDYTITYNYTGE